MVSRNIYYPEWLFTVHRSGAVLGNPTWCVKLIGSFVVLTDIAQVLALSKSQTSFVMNISTEVLMPGQLLVPRCMRFTSHLSPVD